MSIAPEGAKETAFAVSCWPKLTVATPSPPKAATGSPPGPRRSTNESSIPLPVQRPAIASPLSLAIATSKASAASAPSDILRCPSPLKEGSNVPSGRNRATTTSTCASTVYPTTTVRPALSIATAVATEPVANAVAIPSCENTGSSAPDIALAGCTALATAIATRRTRERCTRSAPGDLRQLEGLLVERLAGDRGFAARIAERPDVVGRADAAARDDRPVGQTEHVAVQPKIGTLQRPVPRDRGDEVPGRAGVVEHRDDLFDGRAFLAPALHHRVTATHVDGHQDPFRELLDRTGDESWIERRGGPEDRPAGSDLEHRRHVLERADAAAHLHRAHDRAADVADRVAVGTLVQRGVEVDHVQPARSLLLEANRDLHGIVVVGGLLVRIPAEQPDRPAGSQVDRRDDDHAARSRPRGSAVIGRRPRRRGHPSPSRVRPDLRPERA